MFPDNWTENKAFKEQTKLNKMCLWNTNAPETDVFWEM